jgi:hypothetical protein
MKVLKNGSLILTFVAATAISGSSLQCGTTAPAARKNVSGQVKQAPVKSGKRGKQQVRHYVLGCMVGDLPPVVSRVPPPLPAILFSNLGGPPVLEREQKNNQR